MGKAGWLGVPCLQSPMELGIPTTLSYEPSKKGKRLVTFKIKHRDMNWFLHVLSSTVAGTGWSTLTGWENE